MQSSKSTSSFVTDRPVAVLMIFVAAVVFGFFSFKRLPIALMPELNYPTLTVRTEYPGSAPEEVENEISRPIEEALGVIGGLNRISSIARSGVSDVVLEFLWGTDMSAATQDVLEKLDLVFLPNEAERPLLLHFDPSLDPVIELSISASSPEYEGEYGLRRLRRLAELQIKKELEPIAGVAAVRIRGGLEEEIHVRLDEGSLRRMGVNVQMVIDRLRQENINVAGGTIDEGDTEYMVRTLNEFVHVDQIAETIVKRTNEAEVKIKDIGEVIRSHREREIITRTNGKESVQIDIYKEAEANMVAVSQAVVRRIGRLHQKQDSQNYSQDNSQDDSEIDSEIDSKDNSRNDSNDDSETDSEIDPKDDSENAFQSPRRDRSESLSARLFREEGARLELIADRSIFIQNSIDEVRNTAILGGLLAIIVLFLFLKNLLPTAIVAVSIPMSLMITFAPLNIYGVSLNLMSLGGLALGIGMLVDSSIVVLESIFRCKEEGDNLKGAAIRGTREVRAPVIASTLTSIAVFLPMIFVEGIAGQAFGDLGMSVVISLIASLAVAIFFIPMLASRGKPEFADLSPSISPKHWVSFTSYRQDFSQWKRDWRCFAIPYLIIRLMISFGFELFGKMILMIINTFMKLISKVLIPISSQIFKLITALPSKCMDHLLQSSHNCYRHLLDWALRHSSLMIFLMIISIFTSIFLSRTLGTELLPEVHQGEITFEINLPVGTPLEETERILGKVEKAILADRSSLKALLATYGYDVANIKRSDEGEHSARFKVLIDPSSSIADHEDQMLERLRGYLKDLPDIRERVVRPVLFSSNKPIVVEIQGDDLVKLREMAQQAEILLGDQAELADVETTLQKGAPEIQITYDRQRLMHFGLGLGQVAEQVKSMVKGFEATRYNLKDRRIPIIVQLAEGDRQLIHHIQNLAVNPESNQPIPLSSIAELKIGEGPSEIRRVDGRRVALIQANLGEASLGEAVEKIRQTLLNQLDWQADMSLAFSGQNEEWEQSRSSLTLALGLSLFLVYVIMASQFESLLQPLIIMGTVPLAFFGSVIGLVLLDIRLSIVVFLGLIMLIGIVVNNAIVLVDYANLLRRRGLKAKDAIQKAGQIRLRPILMTTATTVLGLFPMALGLGEGAEIRTPMAITVIFGLMSSTALTLLVIPTLYLLIDKARSAFLISTS